MDYNVCKCWNIPLRQQSTLSRTNTQTHYMMSSKPLPRPFHLIASRGALWAPSISGKEGQEEKADNSFNPCMNALVLSRGDIEKMFQAFPSKVPRREAPGKYLIQTTPNFVLSHTNIQNSNCCFYESGIWYFSPVSRTDFHIQWDDVI